MLLHLKVYEIREAVVQKIASWIASNELYKHLDHDIPFCVSTVLKSCTASKPNDVRSLHIVDRSF